jgi:hypothetical protein
VQHQWDALWHSAAHQLLRAKLYGFLPFEVVYRRAMGGPFAGLVEVERLIDHHPREARLLVAGDRVVGFSYERDEYAHSANDGEKRDGATERREEMDRDSSTYLCRRLWFALLMRSVGILMGALCWRGLIRLG